MNGSYIPLHRGMQFCVLLETDTPHAWNHHREGIERGWFFRDLEGDLIQCPGPNSAPSYIREHNDAIRKERRLLWSRKHGLWHQSDFPGSRQVTTRPVEFTKGEYVSYNQDNETSAECHARCILSDYDAHLAHAQQLHLNAGLLTIPLHPDAPTDMSVHEWEVLRQEYGQYYPEFRTAPTGQLSYLIYGEPDTPTHILDERAREYLKDHPDYKGLTASQVAHVLLGAPSGSSLAEHQRWKWSHTLPPCHRPTEQMFDIALGRRADPDTLSDSASFTSEWDYLLECHDNYRATLAEQQREKSAATKMQSMVRQWLCRCRYLRIHQSRALCRRAAAYQRRKTTAATFIQAIIRRWIARRHWLRPVIQSRLRCRRLSALTKARHHSSICIQTCFRRWRARRSWLQHHRTRQLCRAASNYARQLKEQFTLARLSGPTTCYVSLPALTALSRTEMYDSDESIDSRGETIDPGDVLDSHSIVSFDTNINAIVHTDASYDPDEFYDSLETYCPPDEERWLYGYVYID